MDVKVLVASMTIILIILFFITDHYRKREIELMKAEAAYYKALKELHKEPDNKELQEEAMKKGEVYGEKAKMSEDEVQRMLESDLVATPAS